MKNEKKESVIIYGDKELAEIAYFYLNNEKKYKVAGFTIDKNYLNQEKFCNLPIVAFEDVKKIFPPKEYRMFLPISYINLNKLREEKYLQAKEMGYKFISYISPKATYYNGEIGENSFIFEDNTIQPFTKIGNNCILWSGNHIGHHSIIKDNCFIASQVVISGKVIVEENCFLGVNSTIRDGITIGKNSVIGAGSLVLKDVKENSVISPKNTEPSKITSDRLRKI